VSPAYLASKVAAVVADPRWGGGLRRDHLRELLGCEYRELNTAIAIAYKRGTIDFCWGWVVAPPAAAIQAGAA